MSRDVKQAKRLEIPFLTFKYLIFIVERQNSIKLLRVKVLKLNSEALNPVSLLSGYIGQGITYHIWASVFFSVY